ncbi:probable 4-hydroxy-tetrahydrodipicolinate reductase 2, chloroplastic [Cryptomeria japonica]|uniref:probable 4-hydroxy-tetrahydrodipicolinate reductase 2, chloroplastic n=1 Tax=Cryptomeria japonica TaxID=3369 RepID=UPI0027DAA7FB|nr:probable 4-hydroxy-tetrahydrodipicolinate reductase 2, chloroplastic [Cryptomeria japonica]
MGVPFVMGTTGGDREKLLDVVRKANNYAVIAPQMGKQVVAFQAAMEIMAEHFPEAFSGYKLEVIYLFTYLYNCTFILIKLFIIYDVV